MQLLITGRKGGRMQELSVFSVQLGYELKSPLKISLVIKNTHTQRINTDRIFKEIMIES